MFAKIPKRIYFDGEIIPMDDWWKTWKGLREYYGRGGGSDRQKYIISGRVGSFGEGHGNNYFSFVVINVKKNKGNVVYFDMIFPRIQTCLNQAGPAASGLIFGQDPLLKDKCFTKQCDCGCAYIYSGIDVSNPRRIKPQKAYQKSFKSAPIDQVYPVYRFDYKKYISPHGIQESINFDELGEDAPDCGVPDKDFHIGRWIKRIEKCGVSKLSQIINEVVDFQLDELRNCLIESGLDEQKVNKAFQKFTSPSSN